MFLFSIVKLTKIDWEPLDFPTTSKQKGATIKAYEKAEPQLKQIVDDNKIYRTTIKDRYYNY